MVLEKLCSPSIIYIMFSMTQIIIDTLKKMYNKAILKFFVMIIFTFGLNLLCQRGLTIISWFIVFLPFLMMSVITSLMLTSFNLSPSTGHIISTKTI